MSKGKADVSYLNDFDEIAMRLKHELNVKQDYELAKFFGITPQSYNTRKKNNNFPIEKLKEIIELRPDLSHVDLRWILTGKTLIESQYDQAPLPPEQFKFIAVKLIEKLEQLPHNQQQIIFDMVDVLHEQMKTIQWHELNEKKP